MTEESRDEGGTQVGMRWDSLKPSQAGFVRRQRKRELELSLIICPLGVGGRTRGVKRRGIPKGLGWSRDWGESDERRQN